MKRRRLTEGQKALALFILIAAFPAWLVYAALALAALPWPVIIVCALAAWLVGVVFFCCLYVGGEQ